MNTITIESLQQLATELENNAAAQRSRLADLCATYVRLLAAAKPKLFNAMATCETDEAGSWDTSYPPKVTYTAHNGPRLLQIADTETQNVPTSSGFYYSWKRVTSYGGLWIDAGGHWYRCQESGTGRFGQFAAHPGDCDVRVALSWRVVAISDLELDELTLAEATLRRLSVPIATRTDSEQPALG